MFFSRLNLNLRCHQVLRDLSEPYRMHRTIYSLFPAGLTPNGCRLLYRCDFHREIGNCILYILSGYKPAWEKLDAGYLLPSMRGINPQCSFFAPVTHRGSIWKFSLRANPTYKSTSHTVEGNRGKGRRLALRCEVCPAWEGTHDEERCQSPHRHLGGSCKQLYLWWLGRKGKAGGFRVHKVDLIWEGLVGGKPASAFNQPFFMLAVRYEGILEVTDPQLFASTLHHGIGSGKGFGFGLLTIQPAFY
jgi:CRISPR system Cascade subunit CasE